MALACFATGTGAISAETPYVVSWTELVDKDARAFEDPFQDIARPELSALAEIAKLRELADNGALTEVQLGKLSQQESLLETKGIDVDWLLEQRWVVAENRYNAYWKGNTALEGKRVALRGFFVPARHLSSGELVGYLVPQAGMCSHLPPPPANQLVRLSGLDPSELDLARTVPVEAVGTIKEDRLSVLSNVVDGLVEMQSSWVLEASALVKVAPVRQLGGLDQPKTGLLPHPVPEFRRNGILRAQ